MEETEIATYEKQWAEARDAEIRLKEDFLKVAREWARADDAASLAARGVKSVVTGNLTALQYDSARMKLRDAETKVSEARDVMQVHARIYHLAASATEAARDAYTKHEVRGRAARTTGERGAA